jgi:Fe2+ or Zn2+ uptake regulation protein
MASGQRRFDAGMHAHHHIRCISCSRVDDIPLSADASFDSIVANASTVSGYEEAGCTVDFYGICPECAGKKVRDQKKH